MTMSNPGGHETVAIGGLRFVVMHRGSRDNSGGPTIEVYGSVGGSQVQVLRFDCFRKGPHFHYAPDNGGEQHMLDTAKVGNSLEWALEQVRSHMPEMLRTAGFDDLAESVDARALSKSWTRVKTAVEKTASKG